MLWRDFFQQNLWLKGFALLLAILTWLTIRFEVGMNAPSGNPLITQKYDHLKLTVLRNASDTRTLEVIPNEVSVTISAEASIMREVSEKDIQAYVNLVDLGERPSTLRKVEVNRPRGVLIDRIDPPAVRVELLSSNPTPLTRSSP